MSGRPKYAKSGRIDKRSMKHTVVPSMRRGKNPPPIKFSNLMTNANGSKACSFPRRNSSHTSPDFLVSAFLLLAAVLVSFILISITFNFIASFF